ncbi:MAG: hypothetical protein NTV87_16620 [Ignavibacteriae bacterium]|nr:hypothetical protein [Ignavibacteriota bacterium]
MKKHIYYLLILITVTGLTSCAKEQPKAIYKEADGKTEHYVIINSIFKSGGGNKTVWTKVVTHDAKDVKTGKQYESHKIKYELYCGDHKFKKIREIINYTDGTTSDVDFGYRTTVDTILAGTLTDKLYEIVCEGKKPE